MDNLEFLASIKRLAIVAMFSDDDLMERLVLKGGNLLDIVYGVSTRPSVDLDFSIDGEFEDLDTYRRKIADALTSTFAEAGYVVFDVAVTEVPSGITDDMRSFWGGYTVEFKLIEQDRYDQFRGDLKALRRNAASVGKRGSTKFRIDISKHEYCSLKRRAELAGYAIFVYTPEMAVCEKLRAICQQMPEYTNMVRKHPSARARDFVDIHALAEHFAVDFRSEEFSHLVREMFAVKRVPLNLIGRIVEFRDYHRQDFAAVKDTVKPHVELRDFDYYFDYTVGRCQGLKALWNE